MHVKQVAEAFSFNCGCCGNFINPLSLIPVHLVSTPSLIPAHFVRPSFMIPVQSVCSQLLSPEYLNQPAKNCYSFTRCLWFPVCSGLAIKGNPQSFSNKNNVLRDCNITLYSNQSMAGTMRK